MYILGTVSLLPKNVNNENLIKTQAHGQCIFYYMIANNTLTTIPIKLIWPKNEKKYILSSIFFHYYYY